MQDPLSHIVYVSRSLATPLQLEDIVAQARRRNATRSLTGSLVSSGGHFAQWLEGPMRVVADTVAAILADPRHEAVKTLRHAALPARRFGAWDMAHVEAPGADDLFADLVASAAVPEARTERLLGLVFKP